MKKDTNVNSHPPFTGDALPNDVDVETTSPVATDYRPRTGRSIIIFSVVVMLGLVLVFVVIDLMRRRAEAGQEQAVKQAAAAPVEVDVMHVELSSPEKNLELPGNARSFYETTLFARTSGYLKKWFVDIGDEVKEGQTLATIETPELDDQLAETKARLNELQSEENVAETSSAFAKVTYDRWESAAKEEGVVSAQERDQKKSELESATAKLAAAKSAVNLGEAEVHRLQTLEGFKKVIAPYDGVITARHIDIGDLVTAGSTTNTTPLFTIAKADQIRLFVDVPQPAVPDIHVGMKAYATAREWGERKFEGTVDRTASSLDPQARTLRVEVLVPNPKRELAPGMYMRVTFATIRAQRPVRIPPAALAFGPRGAQAAVVEADGTVNFRDIVISRDLGDAVEIESGLKEGDTVALNVGSQVLEGQKISPHYVDTPSAPAVPAVALK